MHELGRLLERVERPHPYRRISWIFAIPAACGAIVVVWTGDWVLAAFPVAMIAAGVVWWWSYRGVTVALHEHGLRYDDQTIAWREVTRYRIRRTGQAGQELRVLEIHAVAGKPYELHGEIFGERVVDAVRRELDDKARTAAR